MRVRRISSRDNAEFKALHALAEDPREIRKQGRTLADGPHVVALCLRHARPSHLLVADGAAGNPEVAALLGDAHEIDRIALTDALFRAISPVASPIGIAAVFVPPASAHGVPVGDAVLLDAVQDPGNVGAIIRSAAAAGIGDLVLGKGCAGAWTPRVLRAAQGAHFHLRLHEQAELDDMLAATTVPAIATLPRAPRTIYQLDLRAPHLWLFGNEGSGLSRELADRASIAAAIPLAAESESLNVAAAAAVCLFEMRRQRLADAGGLSGRVEQSR